MENSQKLHFADDVAEWYLANGDRWIGPLSAADVFSKVESGEISWAHFVWKPGQGGWRRICEIAAFKTAVPQEPSKKVQRAVKEQSRPSIQVAPSAEMKPEVKTAPRKGPPEFKPRGEEKKWFLHYNSSNFGPFSVEEVRGLLRVGKIHGRVHAWREGMSGWSRLEKVEIFHDWIPQASQKSLAGLPDARKPTRAKQERESEADKRRTPRKPFLARLLMADSKSLITALCRDISVGGMQVLTDHIPGGPGTRLKMNINPSGDALRGKVGAFVAEGVVVRLLEDGRGFSFRFEKLADPARRAIEAYVSES